MNKQVLEGNSIPTTQVKILCNGKFSIKNYNLHWSMLAKLIVVNRKMESYSPDLGGTNKLRCEGDKLIIC